MEKLNSIVNGVLNGEPSKKKKSQKINLF